MTKIKIVAISFFLFHCFLFSQDNNYDPLYAGTLLAIYPKNTAPGYVSIEPFLFFTSRYGDYNKNWSLESKKNISQIELLMTTETGITQFLDISVLVSGFYSNRSGRESIRYGDTEILIGWQVSVDRKGVWVPDFRVLLGESFPTGKYQKLNPSKGGSDGSGSGSYETLFILVLQKIFYSIPNHPYNLNLNLYYIAPTKTKVSGFNVYGGGFGTKGTVCPGYQLIANLGFEYSFNRYWEWGMDVRYEYQRKSKFSGKKGKIEGMTAKVGGGPSVSVSLAPSLGYNFSEKLSIIWGTWFSVTGKNSESFISAVGSVYYYF